MFADLSRIVIEGSRGLGKRVERQDDGSGTDFKNLRESVRSWRYRNILILIIIVIILYHIYLGAAFLDCTRHSHCCA